MCPYCKDVWSISSSTIPSSLPMFIRFLSNKFICQGWIWASTWAVRPGAVIKISVLPSTYPTPLFKTLISFILPVSGSVIAVNWA